MRRFTCDCVEQKIKENPGWHLAYPDLFAVVHIERKDHLETGMLMIDSNFCPLCGKPTEEVDISGKGI